jgi:hypothetical protein
VVASRTAAVLGLTAAAGFALCAPTPTADASASAATAAVNTREATLRELFSFDIFDPSLL